MKIILDGVEGGPVRVCWPSPIAMAGLTGGGFGKLHGDAVTIDLEENEARRVEAANAMPKQRAIANMIRAGHDPDFAEHWTNAWLVGGETDATALELVRRKSFQFGDQIAIGSETVPQDRFYREAWRRGGGDIVVDINAARVAFARRLVDARAAASQQFLRDIEVAVVSGRITDVLDAAYAALKGVDLRKLGQSVMGCKSLPELSSLWPEAVPK